MDKNVRNLLLICDAIRLKSKYFVEDGGDGCNSPIDEDDCLSFLEEINNYVALGMSLSEKSSGPASSPVGNGTFT